MFEKTGFEKSVGNDLVRENKRHVVNKLSTMKCVVNRCQFEWQTDQSVLVLGDQSTDLFSSVQPSVPVWEFSLPLEIGTATRFFETSAR